MTRTQDRGTKQGRGLAAVLGLGMGLAGLTGASGCTAESNRALVILQNQLPETGMGCIVPAKRSELRSVSGVLDVELDRPRPYTMYPLVTNLLPEYMETAPYNPNLVRMTGFEVRLQPPPGITMPDTAGCPLNFLAPADGALVAPQDEVASRVDVLLPCHAAVLRDMFATNKLPSSLAVEVTFTAKVRARGEHGGSTIESSEFTFPVRVCRGCLQVGFTLDGYQNFGLDQTTGNIARPRCDQLTGSAGIMSNPYQGNLCNPAQDFGPLLCCSIDAEGKNIECPGIPRAPIPPAATP